MKERTSILLALVCSVFFISVKSIEYSGPHTSSVKFGGYEHFIPDHLSRVARQTSTNTTSEQNTTIQDDHVYYQSVYYPPGDAADRLWMDLTEASDVVTVSLSNGSRLFAVARLPFQFPYYGHLIDTVAVSTGGFLFTGTFYNPQIIHRTQTIAPLLADFNPGLNLSATILIRNTSSVFTVQWDGVHNRDHVDDGPFTFQVSLFPTGEIHFAYREIPLLVSQINNDNHPVDVGLSDSFYVDQLIFGLFLRRTVFEYSRIRLNASDDLTNSAYVLTPVLNCIRASSCNECAEISNNSDFSCGWCDRLQRCSDGVDRHRQEWFQSGCSVSAVTTCEPPPTTSTPTTSAPTTSAPTTSAPTTSAPTTSAPTTSAPTTSAPTTSAPTTSAPTTSAPTTSAPTTSVLTTSAPTTSAPTTSASTTSAPTTSAPTTSPTTTFSTSSPTVLLVIGSLPAGAAVGGVLGGLVLLVLLVFIAICMGVILYGYKHPTSKIGLFMIERRPKAWSLNKKSASYNVESGKTVLDESQ